jgi:hypothetical protein
VRPDLIQRETYLRLDFFSGIPRIRLDSILDLVYVLHEGGLQTVELGLAVADVMGATVDFGGDKAREGLGGDHPAFLDFYFPSVNG